MSRKIFNSIWFSALSAFLISLILIMIFTYGYFSDVQKKRLKNPTEPQSGFLNTHHVLLAG